MALLDGTESPHVPNAKLLQGIDGTTGHINLGQQYNTVAKWYLKKTKAGGVEASQSVSAGPPFLITSTAEIKIPFRSFSAGKTLVWVLVIIKFSKETLENLERYKLKSTSNTKKLQSIEIIVDVTGSNERAQLAKGAVSISDVLDKDPKLGANKPLVLQLPVQTILTEADRKLDMHLNTELQLRQAGGFTLERVDIVDVHENLVNVANLFPMKVNPILADKSTSEQPSRTTTQLIDAKHPTGAAMIDIPIRGTSASNGLGNRSDEAQLLSLMGTCLTGHPTTPDSPKKWYLSAGKDMVITTQTECAPFLISKTTSVELKWKAAQSSIVSITINLRFPQSLLQQLEKYAAVYKNVKKENKEHGLEYLQSIRVDVQVVGQAGKITNTLCLTEHHTPEASWRLDGVLIPNNISTVVVKFMPGIQVTQGCGFMVDSIELFDFCSTPSPSRSCSGASSTMLALNPIEAYASHANLSKALTVQASPSKTISSQSDLSQEGSSRPASSMSDPTHSSASQASLPSPVRPEASSQNASLIKPKSPQLQKQIPPQLPKQTLPQPPKQIPIQPSKQILPQPPKQIPIQPSKQMSPQAQKPRPFPIFRYKVSKSGTKLITFSFHHEKGYMCVWDISAATQASGPKGGTVCIDVYAGSTLHDTPNCLAFMRTDDMTTRGDLLYKRIKIALSYDGSQVVLVPTGIEPLPAPSSQFFKCDLENKAIKCTETPSELVSFVGYGDFHTTLCNGKDPDTQHELFLACNGFSVLVFSSPTNGTWVKQREIHLAKPPAGIDSLSISDLFCHVVNKVFQRYPVRATPPTESNPNLVAAKKLIRNIRNQHFAWTGNSKVVSVWNLVSGRMVSHVRLDGGNDGHIRNIHTHISVDGSILAIWYEDRRCVETYWTTTGIQTRRFLSSRLIGGQFVAPDLTLKSYKPPLNVFDWTKAPLAVQLNSFEKWRIDTSADSKQVFTCLTRTPSPAIKVQGLQTVFAQLDNRPNQTSGAIKSVWIDSETVQNGCLDSLHDDYRFTFDYAPKSNKTTCTIQWKGTGDPANLLIKFAVSFQYAFVYFQEEKLVLEADSFTLEWKLPQKKEDPCRLFLCWSHEQGETGSAEPAQRYKNMPGFKSHQGNDSHRADNRNDMELNKECAARFMGGIPILLRMLENAKQSDQDDYSRGSIGFAIVGYLGAFINHNPTPDSPRNSVMAELCSGLTQTNKFQLKNLMHQILREKKKWSPLPQYPTYRNKDKKEMPSCPFGILYMLDNGGADAKALVKKLYRHCMDQAESTGNVHYLAPVFESLTDFLKLLPRDASDSLRRISAIKGTDLELITTNHFDGCRYNFQSTIKRDGDEDEKKRAYYVASTGVLWRHRSKQESGDEEPVTIDSPWYWILLRLIAYKLNPFSHDYVQCHDYVQHCDFETNVLDNPGIEAVIGQRWNIAQFYWLSGFAVQCLLLFLIFLTILAKDMDFLFISGWDHGFYILVFIVSGILLWSEVSWIWKHHSKRIRYDSSGLFIFAVPLASCVLELHQMRNGTSMFGFSLSFGSYLLGISLVLISLQLLFELRVNQRVCKFYLVLLNFMSKFMTSFIISFFVVLTVMVTASHLLYTFVGDMRTNGIHIIFSSQSGAPSMDMPRDMPMDASFYFVHIFVAISVLMPFTIYTMLPFILYFATGLLEEIHAVTENDVIHMWNENRLPYVIGAENLTYVVPGLRDKLGYPNQVYFRMTKADELEYNKRQRERID